MWEAEQHNRQPLLCFGCREVQLYGPKTALTPDLVGNAFRAFESALKKPRDQRPESERR